MRKKDRKKANLYPNSLYFSFSSAIYSLRTPFHYDPVRRLHRSRGRERNNSKVYLFDLQQRKDRISHLFLVELSFLIDANRWNAPKPTNWSVAIAVRTMCRKTNQRRYCDVLSLLSFPIHCYIVYVLCIL